MGVELRTPCFRRQALQRLIEKNKDMKVCLNIKPLHYIVLRVLYSRCVYTSDILCNILCSGRLLIVNGLVLLLNIKNSKESYLLNGLYIIYF